MTRWPFDADPRDPFPEPLRDPPDTHELHDALAALWAGRVSEQAVAQLAQRHHLDGRLRIRSRPLPTGPWLPSEADLVRIATDADPGLGAATPDLVLGPLADEPLDRRTLEITLALGAFFRGDSAQTTPQQRWSRAAPLPSVEARAAVRAIARAPLAPWQILERSTDGEAVVVSDLVGLGPPSTPDGPVALRPPGRLLGGRIEPGGLLLARIARGPGGWVATCPLVIPGPLPTAVPRWIRWLAWHDRIDRRGPISTSGLLARQGHALTRRILEAAWARS